METWITKPEVLAATKFSRNTLNRLIDARKFPKPFYLGRLPRWLASDLETFIKQLRAN